MIRGALLPLPAAAEPGRRESGRKGRHMSNVLSNPN